MGVCRSIAKAAVVVVVRDMPISSPPRSSFRRRVLAGGGGLLLIVIAWLLCWPVPYTPQAWTPQAVPAFTGVFAANERLAAIEPLTGAVGAGPEDVAFAADGSFCTGLADGRILRFNADGTLRGQVAQVGRPLGLIFDPAGNLLVADAERGLLSIAPDGSCTVLASGHEGVPFACTNDLDLGTDGTVFFTVSSHLPLSQHVAALIEHHDDGRLLAWDPLTRRTRSLHDRLAWANGVAVAADGASLLVVETSAYRVRRLWLSGARQGQDEIVADNLPGFPDGINGDGRGGYWLAMPAPRHALVDAVHPYPWLKRVILRLPAGLQPGPRRYGLIIHLDGEGRPDASLHDPLGSFAPITNVVPYNGVLHVGSHQHDHLGRLPMPTTK